jgi:hypothetical protein
MEAEYIALTHVAKEAVWLRSLIGELRQNLELEPTLIYEDNQSCIALAKNPIFHARSKHIDIRHHFIHDRVESKEIELKYMSTNEMIADALTKALPHPRFVQHVEHMGLRYDDDYRDREGATNNGDSPSRRRNENGAISTTINTAMINSAVTNGATTKDAETKTAQQDNREGSMDDDLPNTKARNNRIVGF